VGIIRGKMVFPDLGILTFAGATLRQDPATPGHCL
jgi:hypothetical protein